METPISQGPPELSPEQEQLRETSRHFYYVRKADVRMYPGAKTFLKLSIQKYMAKYEVEFLDDDQRLRVSVPLDTVNKDFGEMSYGIMDIQDAMKEAKLLNFFRDDTIENLKKLVETAQIRVSGLKRRNANTAEEREELKVAQDMLRLHRDALAKLKRLHQEWKS
ncbi:hypothetical protein H9Q69_008551 [Fusarium xylarioides]|nr:hypothetical protein H9Q69_008551 [Fusarium xylarioides]KAG5805862.1 hypothetical protein H9Q71_009552 [Fusarium xylarioides]KAG5819284.1 hypothetical protein H9Q74_009562 [Fusarium xylarioides]